MDNYRNIFDSHSHYDSGQFDEDRDVLLSSLPDKGISAVMAAASCLESSEKARKMAERYPYIWCSAGIHPHDASGAPDDLEDRLDALFRYEKCVAVGETGLDYHYDYSPREIQYSVFSRHVAFAVERDLPVIVHDREAHADTMEILRKYHPKGVIHCYSGSAEMVVELLRMDLYIGFTGAATFKNARRALEAIEAIPLDRLLVETDCPYMAPVPLRGKRSDSSMIPYIAQVMADIKGVSIQEILDYTFRNACALYNIPVEQVMNID